LSPETINILWLLARFRIVALRFCHDRRRDRSEGY